jgi:hypothetical protein
VLMAAEEVRRRPDGLRARARVRHPVRTAAAGAGLLAYSWIAAGTAPFTRNALLVVLIPGVVLAVIAYGRPPERIPPPEHMDVAGFSYWAICIAALFEWEASAFRDDARWWHPALTTLIDPMLGARPVKAAAILIWLLTGWALVRRLGPDGDPRYHDHRLRVADPRPVRAGVSRSAEGLPNTDGRRVARLRHALLGRPPGGPARLALARVALLLPVTAIPWSSARLTA